MLYRTLDAVMPRFRQIFSEFGLTEQQWRVLRVLWEQGPTTARELARLTLIPAPSLVGIVDRLTISGLVSRVRSNQDRRNVFIETTDAGKDLEEKVRPRVDKAYDELRLSFDENHWDELIAGLDRLSGDAGNTRDNKTEANSNVLLRNRT
jgi:homoprotocatechuate degradation regulator HpaR